MRQRWRRIVWVLLISMAIAAGAPDASAFAHGPDWTIGRAVVVMTRHGVQLRRSLYLKLSLRNVGTPGRIPVKIFGRWALEDTAKRNEHGSDSTLAPSWGGPARIDHRRNSTTTSRWTLHTAPQRSEVPSQSTARASASPQRRVPRGMRLLGSYRREVSLNQTAILEVPLASLGTPRRNIRRLEVVVMTASVVTDHQFVELAANRHPGY